MILHIHNMNIYHNNNYTQYYKTHHKYVAMHIVDMLFLSTWCYVPLYMYHCSLPLMDCVLLLIEVI